VLTVKERDAKSIEGNWCMLQHLHFVLYSDGDALRKETFHLIQRMTLTLHFAVHGSLGIASSFAKLDATIL
jgi:hypothetical protein